jgi:hypothetical protein
MKLFIIVLRLGVPALAFYFMPWPWALALYSLEMLANILSAAYSSKAIFRAVGIYS